MKYDVYFHNDFDGRASAAVMLAFLRSRGDDIEHFSTIDFHLQKEWLDKDFFSHHALFRGKRNPPIVVDFFYHPATAWWFDHHITTFKDPAWQKKFKEDKSHVLDPDYASCCHLAYASLKKNFSWKAPKNIVELVASADLIDGAQYHSPRETIEIKEPALALDAYIEETRHDAKIAKWMVEALAERPLAEIAAMPRVQKVVQAMRIANEKALDFYKRNLKIEGNTTFIDLTHAPVETLRYASYYLYPKIRYAIRFTMKERFYHLGIGSNPWLGKRSVHIGKLLGHYGGGGHKGAGAADFSSREKAMEALPRIIKVLNQK